MIRFMMLRGYISISRDSYHTQPQILEWLNVLLNASEPPLNAMLCP